tara:strand:+ start:449 stop:805 length:357 start_codon:yes stop_codon:yes gene_type:complete
MTLNKFHLIFLTLYTAVVVFSTWYFVKPEAASNTGLTKENQQIVDSLSNFISVLEYQQLEKDSLIIGYQQDISILDLEIDGTKTKITQIQDQHEEELNDIERFTVTDLDKFFADRYQK